LFQKGVDDPIALCFKEVLMIQGQASKPCPNFMSIYQLFFKTMIHSAKIQLSSK